MKWHSWEVARIGRLTVITVVLLSLLLGVAPASATSIWTSGEFTFGDDEETDPHYQDTICKEKTVSVIGVRSTPQTAQLCVYERPGWRYARYHRAQFEDYFVIGIGSDSFMYNVDGLTGGAPLVEVPNSNDLIFITARSGANNHNLYVIKDFPAQLTLAYDGPGLSKRYHMNWDNYEPLILDWEGREITVGAVGVSRNGDWLVLEDKATGFLFVNPKTYALKWFSNYKHAYVPGNAARIKFVISDDGQFVAAFDPKIQPIIYTVGTACAIESNNYSEAFMTQVQTAQPCPDDGQRMYNALHERFPYATAQSMFAYHFNDKGDVLYFLRGTYEENPDGSVTATYYHLPLQSNGYIPQPESRLDYLALGDSISSGEGDTTDNPLLGTKHYRATTDNEEYASVGIPREKCHISTRSYPYLLAQSLQLTIGTQWNSVACSGAEITDMFYYSALSYNGQAKGGSLLSFDNKTPRLEGYANKDYMQTVALNEFIPGRVEQIKFVKKYKPKVITLTMGANNIDFGGKMQDCVSPEWTLGVPHPGTCSWATNKKSSLASQIQGQYSELLSLYRELYKASGRQAKIYIIGYPRLISGDVPGHCGLNVGSLDDTERQLIVQATDYLNIVIEHAANAAGVKYIDISSSLDNGKLCDEGQEYVTGISTIGKNEIQESFHPNHSGHEKIAQATQSVTGNDLLDYDVCQETSSPDDINCPKNGSEADMPPIPSYFGTPSTSSKAAKPTNSKMTKGVPEPLYLPPYSFSPNSQVSRTLHSDPIDLGDVTTSVDGSLDATLTVPETVHAGYHTLVLNGQTYSGEPIEFTQTILVLGTDSEDRDENSTLDNQQVCGVFLETSGIDSDIDGVDDACDPDITAPRPIYRVRAGESTRTYQDAPEHTDYLYLERNVYATAKTGVSGDYDPDGDGFATIAATRDSTPDGRYANLQTDTIQQPNQVYVSFRTTENGCVRYKPTDSSQVTSSSVYRTFTQETTDTSTCRSQSVSDDLDNDGQPDNTQPPYMGRSGDPSKGEIATRLYLFRSTRAAEVQLGISDYAPNASTAPDPIPVDDTTDYREPWSLLASTQSNPLLPVTYKGIYMVSNIPYVIATTNTRNLCQAYKPASIGTIHMSTQANTNLTLDAVQTVNAVVSGWCN